MTRQVRSIRGEVVDFDLFTIKQQILNTPKSEETKNRERFINKKRRRASRNSIDQLLSQQQQNEAAVREALAKSKKERNVTDSVTTSDQGVPVTPEATKAAQQVIKKK